MRGAADQREVPLQKHGLMGIISQSEEVVSPSAAKSRELAAPG